MSNALYGKGTIKELTKGKYYLRFPIGKDPVTGKYRTHCETFSGTRRQAELRIEELRREYATGKAANADKITLAEWMEKHLQQREDMGNLRPRTIERYRVLNKHIVKHLGGMLVKDITPDIVEGFYASMRKSGVGDTTICQCHVLLKAALKRAVNSGVIPFNPSDRVESPKKPTPNRMWLEDDDARRFAALCTEGTPTANKTAAYIALATGDRKGEVLGLTWAHVVLNGKQPYIYFEQQWTERSEIAPRKTDKGDAPQGTMCPIDASTVNVLLRWKQQQRQELNALGIEQGTTTPVFTNHNGTFINHSRFDRWRRKFYLDNGFAWLVADDGRKVVTLTIGEDASLYPDCIIEWRDSAGWPCDENGKRYSRSYPKPKIRTHYQGLKFHSLRHTHFSMRLADGMDIITAQYLGGWKSPAMLMNVYAHPMAANVWASAGFMDKLQAPEKAVKNG